MTPQNLLASATPKNLFTSPAVMSGGASSTRMDALAGVQHPVAPPPVYAPCPSPAQAPPSPAVGPGS